MTPAEPVQPLQKHVLQQRKRDRIGPLRKLYAAGAAISAEPGGRCGDVAIGPIIMVGDLRMFRWQNRLLPDVLILSQGVANQTALHIAARCGVDGLARCLEAILI